MCQELSVVSFVSRRFHKIILILIIWSILILFLRQTTHLNTCYVGGIDKNRHYFRGLIRDKMPGMIDWTFEIHFIRVGATVLKTYRIRYARRKLRISKLTETRTATGSHLIEIT